jgi:MtaA/CmuA family methyltransferase
MRTLSPKRRFLAAFFGGPVDRIPVANPVSSVTCELMEATGAAFPDVHLDAEGMATLAAGGHTVLGHDAVMPVFSVVQESAGLGCEIDWGSFDTMPTVQTHPLSGVANPMIPGDFMAHPACQTVLEAIRILRSQLGERVAIIGKVFGPWTLSYNTVGLQEFLIDTITNPDLVHRRLAVLKEATVEFGIAQLRAGADVLCIADHTTGSLVRAEMYRDYLLELHKEINARIAGPTVLHCCGPTLDRMDYFAQAGFDSYHFESANDAIRAREVVGSRMTLIGNVNNPDTLLQGTPADVKRECRYAIEAGVDILGPECAVPLRTPMANMLAITEAAKEAAGNV